MSEKKMNLFVSNLPRQLSEDELNEHFSSCGTVLSAKIIMDRDTGQARGFGFVEMSSKEEGDKAIEELDGKELGGRPLLVKEAIERERRPSGGGGGGGNFRDKRSSRSGDSGRRG